MPVVSKAKVEVPAEGPMMAGAVGAAQYSAAPMPNSFAHLIGLLRPRATMALNVRRTCPWGYAVDADDTAIMYVFLKGTAVLTANGSSTNIRQGDIVILNGVGHSLASAPGVPATGGFPTATDTVFGEQSAPTTHEFTIIVYRLNVTAQCRYRYALPTVMSVPSSDGHTPLWHRALSELSRMVRVRGPGGSSAIADKMSELLFTLAVQGYSDHIKRLSGKDAVIGGDPKIVDLVLEIQSRPGADWSIGNMADRLFMSRSTFCDLFTKAMGEAPIQYVTRIRMGIAADALLASNQSADEIAEAVGYGSAPALVRAFRRYFHVTPTEYRRLNARVDHYSGNI